MRTVAVIAVAAGRLHRSLCRSSRGHHGQLAAAAVATAVPMSRIRLLIQIQFQIELGTIHR
jgi:hypothetical protein